MRIFLIHLFTLFGQMSYEDQQGGQGYTPHHADDVNCAQMTEMAMTNLLQKINTFVELTWG